MRFVPLEGRVRDPRGSLRRLARACVVLLALDVLLAWLAVMGTKILLERVWYGLAGYAIRAGDLAQHAAQLEWVWRLQGLAWLGTAVVFLAWLHRAYANLAWLDADRAGYTPRWAVGAFFVPVLNLIHPVHVLADLWRVTVPGEAIVLGRRRIPGGLLAWWSLLVVATVLDPVVLRAAAPVEARLGRGIGVAALAGVAEAAAGVLAIVIVMRITRAQGEAFDRLGGARMAA